MFDRSHWKSRVPVAAILATGVVMLCLFVGKVRQRKEFIGRIDPTSGYRCRFQVASDWRKNSPNAWYLDNAEGEVTFTAPSPHPLRRWIDTHLWHRPSNAPGTIYETLGPNDPTITRPLTNGYPGSISFLHERRISDTHLRINGCPATLSRLESSRYGRAFAMTMLFVYVPRMSATYVIYGLSDPRDSDQVYHEIQSIGASFRVEKVAAVASGKP